MSFINVNLGLLAYADGPASNTPRVRLTDLQWSMMGLPTDNFRNVPLSLAPGESMSVASTARAISFNGSTSFDITASSGRMRITAALGQRTARTSGDATTQWQITKSGDVVTAKAVGGTMPNFAGVALGDGLTLGAAFNAYNQGDYTVLGKTSDSVSFLNPIAQAETVTGQANLYSSGPVQIGDILDITATEFAFPNRGAFAVVRVTDSFIEVINPNALAETITGITTGLAAYPYAYKWMFIAADRRVTVSLNQESTTSIEVEPHIEGDLAKNPGIFLKRGKVFEVTITNPGLQAVNGMLLLAE